jgi:tight adherence protein B
MNLAQSPTLVFVAAAAGIASLWLIVQEVFLRYRRQVGERLSDEFGTGDVKSGSRTLLFRDLSRLARDADVGPATGLARFELLIEQADLQLSLRQLVSAGLLAGAVLAMLTIGFSNSVPAALSTFVVGLLAPLGFVLFRRNRRIETLRRQLPDAFEIMSRTIRAGQTVPRAFCVVADDFDSPLAADFGWCYEQQNLGLSQELALRELARRTGVAELQMLVVALLVQRQSGGSPVELLDNLAKVVRKRIRLREKVKALTAEGRMQALVLLALPPLVLGVMSVTNADYVSSLWRTPWLLAAMAASELFGALWIRRIITFRY